jgi:hypothetical protein
VGAWVGASVGWVFSPQAARESIIITAIIIAKIFFILISSIVSGHLPVFS